MQLSDVAPSGALATRFAEHFAAFGVDEVVPTGAEELTLKFDQKSGFEFAIATTAMKNAVDGVQLVFELAEGASMPKLLPGANHVVPTLEQLPGVTSVTVGETHPEQVTVFTEGRRAASDAVTLLNPTLPTGSTVSVALADAQPNE